MLYRILYSGNKGCRDNAQERLDRFGSAILPMGTVGCYFESLQVAEQVALELTKAHIKDGIEYEVIETRADKKDVDQNLLVKTMEDYDNYCNGKTQQLYI